MMDRLPLADVNPLLIVNFSHPLTKEQVDRIEELLQRKIERAINIPSQVDPAEPLDPQIDAMISQTGLSEIEWQSLSLIINLPSLNCSVAVLLAKVHGLCGYFPAIICLRPVPGRITTCFEVAEIVNLQRVREHARQHRC
jgi:hypothetical protein